MQSARITSVSVGGRRQVSWAARLPETAIDKRPVTSAVWAGELGLAGDDQADKVNHGGAEQAIYVYAREDLDWWGARLGRELRDGMFGENVTAAGLEVTGALVGEVWRLGGAVGQVTSPRVPCVTFRNWMETPGWMRSFRQGGRPGAYLRVLTPGPVQAGDPVEVLDRPSASVSVAAVLEAFYTKDVEVIRRMIAVPGHSSRYEAMLADWLGTEPAVAAR